MPTVAARLERAHGLFDEALQRARIAQTTGDLHEQRLWREVAAYWRTRTASLQNEVEAVPTEVAFIPRLLERLAETEIQIRQGLSRIVEQRELVSQLRNDDQPVDDAKRTLSELQERLRAVTQHADLLRSEIKKLSVRPAPLELHGARGVSADQSGGRRGP